MQILVLYSIDSRQPLGFPGSDSGANQADLRHQAESSVGLHHALCSEAVQAWTRCACERSYPSIVKLLLWSYIDVTGV